jgi:hypothetical protein
MIINECYQLSTFDSAKHADLNLDDAGDLETLLGEARGKLKRGETRRTILMDKGKVL